MVVGHGILLLALWVGWFLVLTGIGSLVVAALALAAGYNKYGSFGSFTPGVDRIFDRFWLGFTAVLFFLQLWHFAAPINVWAMITVSALGIIGCSFLRPDRRRISSRSWLYLLFFLLCFGVIAVWMTLQSRVNSTLYDHGLYYLQQIIWVKYYPVIPGLANLQDRLGFFDPFFLFTAMLDVRPWVPGFRLSASLLMLVLAAQTLLGALRMFRSGSTAGLRQIFLGLLFVPVMVKALLAYNVNTASTDAAVDILSVMLFVYFFAFLARFFQQQEPLEEMIMLIFLSAAGIIIKGSFLFVGFWVMLAAAWMWMVCKESSLSGGRIVFFGGVIAVGFGLIPFLIRNVLVSGYFLYPFPYLSWPFEWRVPFDRVEGTYQWILGFSRERFTEYQVVLKSWGWMGNWLGRMAQAHVEVVIPGVMAILAGIIVCVEGCRSQGSRKVYTQWLVFTAIVMAGITTWFFSTPSLRFMGMLVTIFAAGSITLMLVMLQLPKIVWRSLAVLMPVLILGMILKSGWIPPVADPASFYRTSMIRVKPFTTDSGLVVNVPVDNDQCFDVPVLCTPDKNPRLQLYCSTSARCMFKTNLNH